MSLSLLRNSIGKHVKLAPNMALGSLAMFGLCAETSKADSETTLSSCLRLNMDWLLNRQCHLRGP